ncbi:MAG: DUF5777 family beta-barrel protein [Saprospiraceae bacterium]|nr:DUF5777 family beta-barrel protein [Saprospiraceae bacterium]
MKCKITLIATAFLLLAGFLVQGQNPIFLDRKIINSHSVETLPKRVLDFRVGHRFGDLFGEAGGWQTFYGLESASDVLIGFDYGVTDHLMVGINRSKGSGALRMLVNGYIKYKVGGQNSQLELPAAVTFLAYTSVSTMPKSDEISAINSFPDFAHRMVYHFQGMVAKQVSPGVSMQFNLGYTHRNFVNIDDINFVLNVGVATRIRVSRRIGVLVEANYPLRFQDVDFNFTVPAGIGFEFVTGGGHVFQLNFTNATGLSETDYLLYTKSKWEEGQFRMGFTIARNFKI